MLPHCRYCCQEGRFISVCPVQPPLTPHCHRCGDSGHLIEELVCPTHPTTATRKEASTTKRTADIGAAELARCASSINAIISLTRDVPV
ncbi:hypothetical protein CLU79DRAFT_780880, partial [Phycomyces nitens]